MSNNASNIEPKTKPSTYGVTLGTWGTTYGSKRGYWNELKALLGFGELGTQHARLTITIPHDEAGRQLVEQYCKNPPIPYEFKKRVVKEAIKNKDGKWVAGDKILFAEEAIVINFSWCSKRTEGEVPYALPGYSGDSYIKGMKLTMDKKTLGFSWKELRFVWKNKKVKTLYPKIHHLDRIIQYTLQTIIQKVKHMGTELGSNVKNRKKIEEAIVQLTELATKGLQIEQQSAEELIANIKQLQVSIHQKLKNTLGDQLYPHLKLSPTPIQDLLQKHSKDTSAEEEMMLIGSGLAPSHEVRLPIILPNQKNQVGALDVESMLKTMHKIAKEGSLQKKGWTVSRNCSETARRILFSGITQGDKDLERVFRTRNSLTSPQKLLNWALKYQALITEKAQEYFLKPVYHLFKGRNRSSALSSNSSKNRTKVTSIKQNLLTEELKRKFKNRPFIRRH